MQFQLLDFYCLCVWRHARNELVTFSMTLLAFNSPIDLLMVGTIFGELHFVRVYKIVASKVICGVKHCPRYFIVECTGSCLLPSAPLCFAFHVLLCFVDFLAGAILLERCLSLVALLLGLATLACFDRLL